MRLFLTFLASLLLLGNSHTYFHSSYTMLPQIARSEGIVLDINVFTRGGYCFSQHLDSPYAMELVRRGGYDIVFLQDRSMNIDIPLPEIWLKSVFRPTTALAPISIALISRRRIVLL